MIINIEYIVGRANQGKTLVSSVFILEYSQGIMRHYK